MSLYRPPSARGHKFTPTARLRHALLEFDGHVGSIRRQCSQTLARLSLDANGSTALILATVGGHIEVMRCLVQEFAADVSACSHYGVSATHIAAQTGHADALRYLVTECGADVNLAAEDGSTPVWLALEAGHREILHCLMHEYNADVDHHMIDGATYFHIAAQNGRTEMLRQLARTGGPDVNHQTRKVSVTALHLAVMNGHIGTVRCLVDELGASTDLATTDGRTALHIAAQLDHLSIVRFLVTNAGADVNRACDRGITPAMIALHWSNTAVVKFLGRLPGTTLPSGFEFEGVTYPVAILSEDNTLTQWLQRPCTNKGCVRRGRKKCRRCGLARYCSTACQAVDWKRTHKDICSTAGGSQKGPLSLHTQSPA
jgi:ankyrin repeat protein